MYIPKRLAGPTVGTGSAQTVYTCPTGRRAIISLVHFSNGAASPQARAFSIGTYGTLTTAIVSSTYPLMLAGDAEDWRGPYILEAGEVLQQSSSANVVCTVTGEEQPLT